MTYYKDIAGQTFGELTAVHRNADHTWHCVCSCGQTKNVKIGSLTSGNTRSCGHLAKENAGSTIIAAGQITQRHLGMPLVALERQLLSDPKFVQAIGYIRQVLANAGCEVKTGYVVTDGKDYTMNRIKGSKIKALGYALLYAVTTDAKKFNTYAAARRSPHYQAVVQARLLDRKVCLVNGVRAPDQALASAEMAAHVLSKLKFSDPESARKADLELVKARRVMQRAMYDKLPRTKPMPIDTASTTPSESTPTTPKDANTPSAGWCKVLQYDSDKSIHENDDESHGDSE